MHRCETRRVSHARRRSAARNCVLARPLRYTRFVTESQRNEPSCPTSSVNYDHPGYESYRRKGVFSLLHRTKLRNK